MNVSIVFEILEEFDGPVVNSVWDDEEKAYWCCDNLNKGGIITYYETYEVLDGEPRTGPYSFTE